MEEVSPDTCSSHVCHVLGGFQYFQSMTSYPPVFYPFLFNLLYFAIGKAFKWRRLISFLLSLSLSPLSLIRSMVRWWGIERRLWSHFCARCDNRDPLYPRFTDIHSRGRRGQHKLLQRLGFYCFIRYWRSICLWPSISLISYNPSAPDDDGRATPSFSRGWHSSL